MRRRGPPREVDEPGQAGIHGPVQDEENVVALHADHEAPVPRRFDDLFLELHDRLFRALYFVTGSSADAEELMQDAFLKLWERWDSIDTIADPTAYLFRIALNGSRMRARRARVAARKLFVLSPPPDPYDEIELREDVHQMLLELPPRQRAALVLTDIFDYSSEQAAQILGIRPTSVRVLASRGRAALRGATGV
jgi:RNA polymerase sigma factor (sigma-70 family)